MSEPIKVVFPSGRVEFIANTPREQLQKQAEPRKPTIRTAANRIACKHVGVVVAAGDGCAAKQHGIWECAIFGKCKPLAMFRGTPTVPSCVACERYEPSTVPGLLDQIKSVGDATARWITAGRPRRTKDKVAAIMEMCAGCPHEQHGKLGPWCGRCGCWIAAKAAMSTESCPLDPPRWTAEH